MSAVPRPAQILLVGQKIRQIRKSRHLTQSDLAGRIGVTQSDLSRMENGEYKVGLDTLFKILQVFEMSMSGFFEEPAAVPPSAETEESRASEVDRRRERLVADWASLSEDGQAEVLEFVAFKRMQETRRPRWKEEAEAADPGQPAADGEEPKDA